MAILIAEGFDDGIMRGGSDTVGTPSPPIPAVSTANPRTGTRHMRISGETSVTSWYDSPAFTSLGSGRFYVATNIERLPTSSWSEVFELWDSVGVAIHLHIDLMASGKFRVRRGVTSVLATPPILASGTFTYTPGTYVGLCLEWSIDDASGVFNLYVNGNPLPDIAFTGDTKNLGLYGTGGATVDFIRMGDLDVSHTNASTTTFDFDDLVAQDNTGAAPENAFLGDVQVPYTFPTANGGAQNWAIGGTSPAATAWESVKEIPADEGVTTIESDTVGNISRFVYGNVPTTASPIYAVIPLLRALKAEGGTRLVQMTADDGVNTLNGIDQAIGTTDYVSWQPTVWHRQQNGTTPWTAAQINASTFGPELTT